MNASHERPLLVLDLDETLIWATEKAHDAFDFRAAHYRVTRRPHLAPFIDTVFEWFDVAVWTSSTAAYAEIVIDAIFPDPSRLLFAWSRERCTAHYDHEMCETVPLKDLGKIRRGGFRSLERTLIVDDSPEKLARHYGNLLRVERFEGDLADRELADLVPYLDWIRAQPNFRLIEKRFWRRDRPETG